MADGRPMAELGVLLEARAVHTGRSARNHLLALAQTNGVSRRRVDELIDMVGLTDVASKRVGGYSLGMGQRLGIASALLGDPRCRGGGSPERAVPAPPAPPPPAPGSPLEVTPGPGLDSEVTKVRSPRVTLFNPLAA